MKRALSGLLLVPVVVIAFVACNDGEDSPYFYENVYQPAPPAPTTNVPNDTTTPSSTQAAPAGTSSAGSAFQSPITGSAFGAQPQPTSTATATPGQSNTGSSFDGG